MAEDPFEQARREFRRGVEEHALRMREQMERAREQMHSAMDQARADIERAIRRKKAFEADPARHSYSEEEKA